MYMPEPEPHVYRMVALMAASLATVWVLTLHAVWR